MPTGTIARLLIDKGFGFIRDEGGIEHFFHRSSVRGAVFELLREGQRVEFTPEDSQKGPRAGDVRLIEGCPHVLFGWRIADSKKFAIRAAMRPVRNPQYAIRN